MALERRSTGKTIFLQAKHYCLWQELKKPAEGSEAVEVTNPKTGVKLTKHGFAYRNVTGRVTKFVRYDTEKKFPTRYFGYKMHLEDKDGTYVLEFPYQSQILRRFLRVMPSIDWTIPLSITVFKGKRNDGAEETAVWFQQKGATVPSWFTRETPHGMPDGFQDPHTKVWDFSAQHRFLITYLIDRIMPAIELAAARLAPPVEPMTEQVAAGHEGDEPDPDFDPYGGHGITDDDVPF